MKMLLFILALCLAGCANYDRTYAVRGDVAEKRVSIDWTLTPAAIPGNGKPTFKASVSSSLADDKQIKRFWK